MNNPTPLLPAVPPQMPQVKPNAFLRWLARCTLRMGGWKVTGTLPDIPRLVFIIAPHSSNWDGLWGMAAKIALGMKVKVLGKASLFWWPLGPLLHKLGVIPLDRSSPQGTVGQAVDLLRNNEKMWFAIPRGHPKGGEGVEGRLPEDRPDGRRADPGRLFPLPGKDHRHRPAVPADRRRCCRHGRHPRVLPAVDRQDPRHGLSRPQAVA